MSIAFCADARGAVDTRAKTKAIPMKRIPWRSLLVWAVPVLAFAWLAVAGRAASHPVMPPGNSLLGGGSIGSKFVPLASYQLHFTTVRLGTSGTRIRFFGDWNGRCEGWDGA